MFDFHHLSSRFSFVMLLLAPLMISGCETTGSGSGPKPACKAGDKKCIDRQFAELQAMIADPENKWISRQKFGRQRVLASTIRTMAFLGSAEQLTCSQIRIGHLEVKIAGMFMSGSKDKDPTLGQALNRALTQKTLKALHEQFDKKSCEGELD